LIHDFVNHFPGACFRRREHQNTNLATFLFYDTSDTNVAQTFIENLSHPSVLVRPHLADCVQRAEVAREVVGLRVIGGGGHILGQIFLQGIIGCASASATVRRQYWPS
jgi:hypothetical protein